MALPKQDIHTIAGDGRAKQLRVSSVLLRHGEFLGIPHLAAERRICMGSTTEGAGYLLFSDQDGNLYAAWESGGTGRWTETMIFARHLHDGDILDYDSARLDSGTLQVVVLHRTGSLHKLSTCQIQGATQGCFAQQLSWLTEDLPVTQPLEAPMVRLSRLAMVGGEQFACTVADRTTLLSNYVELGWDNQSDKLQAIPASYRASDCSTHNAYGPGAGRIDQDYAVYAAFSNGTQSFFVSFVPDVPLGYLGQISLPDGQVCSALAPGLGVLVCAGKQLAYSRYNGEHFRIDPDFTTVAFGDTHLAPGLDRVSAIWISEHVDSMEVASRSGTLSIWLSGTASRNGADTLTLIHLTAHVNGDDIRFSDPVAIARDCRAAAPLLSTTEHRMVAIGLDGQIHHRMLDLYTGMWKDNPITLRPAATAQSRIAYAMEVSVEQDGRPCAGQELAVSANMGCNVRIHDGASPYSIHGWIEGGEAVPLRTDQRGRARVIYCASDISSPEFKFTMDGQGLPHHPAGLVFDEVAGKRADELRAATYCGGPRAGQPVFAPDSDIDGLASDLNSLRSHRPAPGLLQARRLHAPASLGDRLANFLHEFFDWAEHVASAVADSVYQLVIRIGGEICHFVVDTLHKATQALGMLLKRAAVYLGEALAWVGSELFGTGHAAAMHAALTGTIDNTLAAIRHAGDAYGKFLNQRVLEAKAYVDRELDGWISQATGGKWKPDQTQVQPVAHSAHSPACDWSCYGLNPLDLLHLGQPELVFAGKSSIDDAVGRLLARLEHDAFKEIQDIANMVMRVKTDLLSMSDAQGGGLALLLKLAKDIFDAAADTIVNGLDALVAMFDFVLELLADILHAEIRFAPLEALVAFMGSLAGMPGLKPTILNLVALPPVLLACAAGRVLGVPDRVFQDMQAVTPYLPLPPQLSALPHSSADYDRFKQYWEPSAAIVAPVAGEMANLAFVAAYTMNDSGYKDLVGLLSSGLGVIQGVCGVYLPSSAEVARSDKKAEAKSICTGLECCFTLFAASATGILCLKKYRAQGDPGADQQEDVADRALDGLNIVVGVADLLYNTGMTIADLAQGQGDPQAILLGYFGSSLFDISAISGSSGGLLGKAGEEAKPVFIAVSGCASLGAFALQLAQGVLALKAGRASAHQLHLA